MVLVLRAVIMVVVVLLALGQLGVNTQLLTLAFAAVLLCLASAMAMLIGLGGRNVAREVAAGRYLRRILNEGDHVHSGAVDGTVVALHAATTEMESEASARPTCRTPCCCRGRSRSLALLLRSC